MPGPFSVAALSDPVFLSVTLVSCFWNPFFSSLNLFIHQFIYSPFIKI